MPKVRKNRSVSWRTLLERAVRPPRAVWDIGSVRTRVIVGDKVIFNQPTCIAIRLKGNKSIAFGDAAYALLGNRSSFLRVVFPLKHGCVADQELLAAWITHVRTELWPNRRWFPFSPAPGGEYILDPNMGNADIAVWQQTLTAAGMGFLRPRRSLADLPLLLNIPPSDLVWVLGMGGDHSVIALVQQGNIVASRSISWGGISLTEQLQRWLASTHQCQVSWQSAEQLKCVSGSFVSQGQRKVSLRGKSLITQLGVTVSVSANEVSQTLLWSSSSLILQVKQFLSSLSSDQATACLENGLWILGGTAQSAGIDRWLAKELGASVSVIEKPSLAAACAAALLLQNRNTVGRG